jgi:hypothetical protein
MQHRANVVWQKARSWQESKRSKKCENSGVGVGNFPSPGPSPGPSPETESGGVDVRSPIPPLPDNSPSKNGVDRASFLERTISRQVLERKFNFVDNDRDDASKKQELARWLAKKKNILKDDPFLRGLSPLYREYCGSCWWFEAFQFLVIVVVVAVVPTMLQWDDASVLFLGFFLSMLVLVVLCNTDTYLDPKDEVLAQMGEIALISILSLGALTLVDSGMRSEESSTEGGLSVTAFAALSLFMPFLLFVFEFVALVVLALKVREEGKRRRRASTEGFDDIDTEVQSVFKTNADTTSATPHPYQFDTECSSSSVPNQKPLSMEMDLPATSGIGITAFHISSTYGNDEGGDDPVDL